MTTTATHCLFQNLELKSAYSFTVAAYTIALGPSSKPTVVNYTEQCRDKSGSAALGALTGILTVIIIVLGIICICVLAYFYPKQKIRYMNQIKYYYIGTHIIIMVKFSMNCR